MSAMITAKPVRKVKEIGRIRMTSPSLLACRASSACCRNKAIFRSKHLRICLWFCVKCHQTQICKCDCLNRTRRRVTRSSTLIAAYQSELIRTDESASEVELSLSVATSTEVKESSLRGGIQ